MALQELAKDLELVAVEYDQGGQKAVLTFLDAEQGFIRDEIGRASCRERV